MVRWSLVLAVGCALGAATFMGFAAAVAVGCALPLFFWPAASAGTFIAALTGATAIGFLRAPWLGAGWAVTLVLGGLAAVCAAVGWLRERGCPAPAANRERDLVVAGAVALTLAFLWLAQVDSDRALRASMALALAFSQYVVAGAALRRDAGAMSQRRIGPRLLVPGYLFLATAAITGWGVAAHGWLPAEFRTAPSIAAPPAFVRPVDSR